MHKRVRFSGTEKVVHAKIKNELQTETCWICREDRQKLWITCVDIKEKERQMLFLEITYRISIPGKNPSWIQTNQDFNRFFASIPANVSVCKSPHRTQNKELYSKHQDETTTSHQNSCHMLSHMGGNGATFTALKGPNMQSTYILVLRTLLRDHSPFLLLLLLILSLTSWDLNAPKTHHRMQCGGGKGKGIQYPSVADKGL